MLAIDGSCDLISLVRQVSELRDSLLSAEAARAVEITAVHPSHRRSAPMSEREECVMLNKGPYISEAIGALDSILTRMHDHQDKKRSLLRRLRSWEPRECRTSS